MRRMISYKSYGGKMKKIVQVVADYGEDILIFSGLVVIIVTTFFVSKIAGGYVTGGVLIGLGAYLMFFPPRRK